MVTAPIMKNDNWYIQSAIPVRNFVKFYKNSQQRLAWSGFFVQTFSVWIKFLDKEGFSGFENKWIFIFDMFNSKSLEVADCMSRQGKVLSRRFINFSSLGVVPVFRKSFWKSSLWKSNIIKTYFVNFEIWFLLMTDTIITCHTTHRKLF